MKYKTLKNVKYLGFKGFIENNIVKYEAPLDQQVLVGEIKIADLKRSLIEQNLKVETEGDTLIVEDEIRITNNEDGVLYEGTYGNLYYKVRDILKECVVYL
jgi:hypothetical protein